MKKHLFAVGKALGLVWSVDRLYPFLLLGRSLISAVLPLYVSVCASLLVNELAGAKNVEHIIWILVSLMAGVLCGKFVGACLEWKCSCRYMRIQDAFTARNSLKAMKMEYRATEDSEIADLYVHAWKANMSSGAILESVFSVFGRVIQIAGCVGIILQLGPILLVCIVIFVVLHYFLDYQGSVRQRQYERDIVPIIRAAEYTRSCMGDASYAKDVRLYYPLDFFLNRLVMFQGKRREKERGKEYYCGTMQSFQAILQMLQTVVLYIALIYRFLQGDIQIGYFSLAVSSITIFMGAVKEISAAWNQIIKNEVFLGYLDRFQKLPEGFGGNRTAEGEMQCVEFRSVWFRYHGASEYALEDINVVLNKGDIMTIVGENGSGKSTFVKLLLGLYRPTKGEILLNGINIEEYSDEAYRKMFAPVFQDYQLFAYSIKENMVFAEEYDAQKVDDVLRELHLDKKINSLPEGIEQYVGKGYEKSGVELSGGEKQKVAIARALLKDSACMVLDEPTAALDPIAEVELYRQIYRMAQDKACVFITHRLSGIRFSNKILYFRDGRIAEYGSCQELLDRKEDFYEFYQLQAKFYQG